MANDVINTELNVKNTDGSFTIIHPVTKEENIITPEGKESLRDSKFDDVEAYVDGETELNVINFKANGKIVKTIEISGGGGLKAGTLSTTLADRLSIRENETLVIPYTFNTSNRGDATLYINIICGEKTKDLEYKLNRIGAGSVNIGILDKGINNISMYVIDYMGQMTNIVTFTVVCGSIEISSTFDDEQDFNSYAAIKIPFNVSALDKTATMIAKINIDGIEYTSEAVEGYNSYVFPSENKVTGVHPVNIQVISEEFKSNILEFNIVIVDENQILVSTKQSNLTVEEGNNISIDYRISTIGQNMFDVTYYLNGDLYKEQNAILGKNNVTIPYDKFAIGDYVLEIRVKSTDATVVGDLNCSIKVTQSSFKRIEFVKPGLQVWFDMSKKTNQDIDRDYIESEVLTDNGKRAKLVLHDYNYATNGWIDGRLVNNGVSWAEMENYLPLEDNAVNGFTFDISFTSFNTGDNNARVVECLGDDTPYLGFYIDSEKARINTSEHGGEKGLKVYYTDQADMRVTFVVNRTSTKINNVTGERESNPMVQIYINGIFTETIPLSDSGTGGNKVLENILNYNKLLINTDKNKELFGSNKIKSILIYNRALEHEEVLQNLMADIDNLVEQKKKYDKNYVTINQDLPTVYFTDTDIGKHANMNKESKQWIDVNYVSPDVEKFGESFHCISKTSWQGTSSLQYPIKNYKIRLYDYALDENGNIDETKRNDPTTYKKKKIDLYSTRDGTGYSENTFCLKADYMDSSHCRNTGTARLVNDLLFKGCENPAKQKDPMTRETIDGFLCQLYINGEWIGIYNFNLDKSCKKSLGFDVIPDTVRWEIKANSDTSEGAFCVTWNPNDINDIYTKILADFEIAYDEDAFEDETGEYDVTKYYDYIGIPHEGTVIGTYKDYSILSLARFIKFVNDSDEKTFKEHASEFFNVPRACRYNLNVMNLGMIDNFAKNCMITMYGDDIWWFGFYDMDSSLGLNNEGTNAYETDIEPSQPNVYNCSASKMWTKLNKWMKEELFNEYKKIREDEYTYENVCKYLIEDQIDIVPEIAYNRDQYTKYISQDKQYLSMLHGNNKDHLLRWLYNRFLYVDSLYLQQNSPYTKESITIRAAKPDWVDYRTEIDPESGATSVLWDVKFEIETYCPQYVTICWRKNTYETKRVGFNEKVIFTNEMKNEANNEIIIYCAGNLKRIGDLTDMSPENLILGNAKRLIELKCEKSPNLLLADISKNSYLKEVSFRDCSNLGELAVAQTLDVSTCTNLRKVDVRGTQVTAIKSSNDGGNLEEIYYSDKTQSIVLSRQTNLKIIGIPYGYQNIWTGLKNVVSKENLYVTYDGTNFNKTNTSNAYTVLKDTGSSEITTDNLWELNSDPIEILYPVQGTTIEFIYFDENKNFINKNSVTDTNTHTTQKIVEINPPSNVAFAMINVRIARPMTLNNNIDNLAIVKKGNRDFIELQDLANVQISNCLYVKKLSLYSGLRDTGNKFQAMANVQSLTIDNSLDIQSLNFQGFKKLHDLDIKNMFVMTSLGFDDMIDNVSNATLYNVKITNCPLIKSLSMNVTDEDHSVRFADGATLDISGLTSVNEIITNYSIKGLRKLILPIQVKHLYFTNNFGDGINDIKNIWSNEAIGDHLSDNFEGIDFKNMTIETINMEGLTYIKDGLNFNIAPVDQHPNMNKNRNGSDSKPWFRPSGIINLTNYNGSMVDMFRGIDTTKLNIVINSVSKEQTNLSGLFANALISDINIINNVITKFPNAINMNNLLTNVTPINSISDIQLPDNNISLREAFSGMTEITSDIIFSTKVIDVNSAFKNCTGMTVAHSNWKTTYDKLSDFTYCYMNCANIKNIDDDLGTLNEIPRLWGGYGFDLDVTMVAKINTEKSGTKVIRIANQESTTVHLYTDWGDGTVDGNLAHTYSKHGEYTIKTQKISTEGVPFDDSFKQALISVTQMPAALTSYNALFKNCKNLVEATFTINDNTESLSNLFYGCELLENVNINLPSSCKTIDNLFNGCQSLNNVDFVSTWNTTNLNNMYRAFYYCNSIVNIDVSQWNIGNVTNISGLFNNCTNIKELDVSNWDTTNIKTMSYAFSGCSSLTTLDVTNWTLDNTSEIKGMFAYCTYLNTLDVSKWNTSNVTSLLSVFAGCSSLTTLDVSNWNTSKVTSLQSTFQGCSELISLDLSKWDTGNVTSMVYGLSSLSKLQSLDLSNWKFNNVTNVTGLFASDNDLKTIKLPDMSNNKITRTQSMFQGCSALTNIDLSTFNTSLLIDSNSMFTDCESLTDIIGIENITTSKITNMYAMFQNCKSLIDLDLSSWNVGKVVNLANFVSGCVNLKTLNLQGWQTGALSNESSLISCFQNCEKLTTLDVSGFDVSLVTSLNLVFADCDALTDLDLSSWNVGNIKQFDSLAQNCYNLTNINVSTWNTRSAETLSYMFSGCSSLETLDLSNWDLNTANNVNDSLHYTFNNCTSLGDLKPPKNINANVKIPDQKNKTNVVNIINNLADRTGKSSATLTLGANNLALLGTDKDSMLATASQKNWSVV